MSVPPRRETIAAIATAPGRGGVGVVRISGSDLAGMAAQLAGRALQPRHAHYLSFRDNEGQILDQGLALFFPAPYSYTGEDVIELQGHGGPLVLQMLLRHCLSLGARLAEPGEFTRRAYLNDKLDLAQAEAVADLIEAGSEAAVRSAQRSLSGEFSRRIDALVEQLIRLRMLVEASLDFPEEGIDFLAAADASGQLQAIRDQLTQILASSQQGSVLREGLHVVLIGQPNVGKSSLINALAGEDVAIVAEVAGTTRDTVRELIQIDGVPLHVVDTAGLRDTEDIVEQLGIARTWAAVERADVALVLIDSRHAVTAADQAFLDRLPARLPRIFVFNKIDLSGDVAGPGEYAGHAAVRVSARHGQGLPELRQALLQLAGWQGSDAGVFLARERHLDALRRAAAQLQAAAALAGEDELLAEELRLAQQELARITGEFSADDLLGEIFSRFCIGK